VALKLISIGTGLATIELGTTRRLTMKTYILFALIALFVSACASRQEVTEAKLHKADGQIDHYSMIEGGGSRIR
jgi:hypothetical protein